MDGWTHEESAAVGYTLAFVDTYLIYAHQAMGTFQAMDSIVSMLAPITANVRLFAILDTLTCAPAGKPGWVELAVTAAGRLLHLVSHSDSIAKVLKEQGFSQPVLQNISTALAAWLDRRFDPLTASGPVYSDLPLQILKPFSLACHTLAGQAPVASAAPAPPCGTSARATVWQCVLGVPAFFRVLLRASMCDCMDQVDHLRAARAWLVGHGASRTRQSSSSAVAPHVTASDIQRLLQAPGPHSLPDLQPADLVDYCLSVVISLLSAMWQAIDSVEQTRAFFPLATFLLKLLQRALAAEHSAPAAAAARRTQHFGMQWELSKPSDIAIRASPEAELVSWDILLDNFEAAAAVLLGILNPFNDTRWMSGAALDPSAHAQLLKSRARWAMRSGLLDITEALLRRLMCNTSERPVSGVQLARDLMSLSTGVALHLPDEPRAQLAFHCHFVTVRKMLERRSQRQDKAMQQQDNATKQQQQQQENATQPLTSLSPSQQQPSTSLSPLLQQSSTSQLPSQQSSTSQPPSQQPSSACQPHPQQPSIGRSPRQQREQLYAQHRTLLGDCAELSSTLFGILVKAERLMHLQASVSPDACEAQATLAATAAHMHAKGEHTAAAVHFALLQLLPALVRIARVSRSLLRHPGDVVDQPIGCASLFLSSFTGFNRRGFAHLTAAAGAPEVAALAMYWACHSVDVDISLCRQIADQTRRLLLAAGSDVSWCRDERRLGLALMVREVSQRSPQECDGAGAVCLKASVVSGPLNHYDAPAELQLYKLSAMTKAAAAAAEGGDVRRVVGRSLPFMGCWDASCTNLEGPSEATLPLRTCGGCRLASYCRR